MCRIINTATTTTYLLYHSIQFNSTERKKGKPEEELGAEGSTKKQADPFYVVIVIRTKRQHKRKDENRILPVLSSWLVGTAPSEFLWSAWHNGKRKWGRWRRRRKKKVSQDGWQRSRGRMSFVRIVRWTTINNRNNNNNNTNNNPPVIITTAGGGGQRAKEKTKMEK